jgi:hypothetical protein
MLPDKKRQILKAYAITWLLLGLGILSWVIWTSQQPLPSAYEDWQGFGYITAGIPTVLVIGLSIALLRTKSVATQKGLVIFLGVIPAFFFAHSLLFTPILLACGIVYHLTFKK